MGYSGVDNFWVFSYTKNHGITDADLVIKFNIICQCIGTSPDHNVRSVPAAVIIPPNIVF